MVAAIKSRSKTVTIGLVGKYVQLHDAYLSVAEALRHAGFYLDAKVNIRWIDSEARYGGNGGVRCSPVWTASWFPAASAAAALRA